jgi:Mis12-Mtw1 protein family
MAAYDEEDGGFKFSRTRSKRTQAKQAQPEPVPVPEPEVELVKAPEPPTTSRKRKTFVPSPEPPPSKAGAPAKRRSKRISGEKPPNGSVATPLKFTRRKTRTAEPAPAPPEERDDSPALIGQDIQIEKSRNGTKIALPFADTPVIQRNKEMRAKTKTTNRRSSSGLRGRRASSLIDSGTSNGRQPRTYGTNSKVKRTTNPQQFLSLLAEDEDSASSEDLGSPAPAHALKVYQPDLLSTVLDPWESSERGRSVVEETQIVDPDTALIEERQLAGLDASVINETQFLDILKANLFSRAAVPHADVDTRDFYKHIEQSLLEPQRMKQLLIWCGTRAMPEKLRGGSGNANEELAVDSGKAIYNMAERL